MNEGLSVRGALVTGAARWLTLAERSTRRVPVVFAVLGVLLGSIYALWVPPFQVPDEHAHFVRAYQVSMGICRGPLRPSIPTDVMHFEAQFPQRLNETDAVDDLGARLARAQRQALRPNILQSVDPNFVPSSYSCITYLPQVAGIGIARALRMPVIDIFYGGRIANLLAYVGLVMLALTLLPSGLQPFGLLLGLMPMALTEAASLSQDALVNGISLLFVCYVGNLAWAPRAGRIGWSAVTTLLGLAALLGQCKLSLLLTPLVLLVPAARWPAWWFARVVFLVGTVAICVLSFMLWRKVGIGPSTISPTAQLDFAANIRFVLHDPGLVISRVIATVELDWWFYVESFVGVLGWLNVELNPFAIVAYASVLVVLVLVAPVPVALTPARRALCAAVAAIGIGATLLVFWTITSPSTIALEFVTGQGVLEGVQGRYFIPFAIPVAFVAVGALRPATRRVPAAERVGLLLSAVAMALLGSAAAFAAIYDEFIYPESQIGITSYDARHPARFYEGRFIHQKGSDGRDDMVLYVIGGARYWIENPRWFRKHHLEARELDAAAISPKMAHRIPWGGVVFDADTIFQPSPEAVKHDGEFARDARGGIWIITHGVRHRINDPDYVRREGYPVEQLAERVLARIPIGDAIENYSYLDGRLIQATDAKNAIERARVYFIQGGVKHWIADPHWLKRNGKRLDEAEPLPNVVVDRIPEGAPVR